MRKHEMHILRDGKTLCGVVPTAHNSLSTRLHLATCVTCLRRDGILVAPNARGVRSTNDNEKRPTQGQAHLDLVAAARSFASRQTTETFERLASAVLTARTLNVY